MKSLSLSVLPQRFAICQLALDADLSFLGELGSQDLWSATRTDGEFSVVLAEERILPGWRAEKGWRCLKVLGPLDFALTGVLASLVAPLAEAEISVFALSTYDTDYLLVRDADLQSAVAVLSVRGHTVRSDLEDIGQAHIDLYTDISSVHKGDERL